MSRLSLPLTAAILIGVAVTTLSGLLAGAGPQGLTAGGAYVALITGLVSGWLCLRAARANQSAPAAALTFWQLLMLFVFALAALRSFLWLVYESGPMLVVGSRFNLGDISLHLHFIHYLASGVSFWPANSIFIEGWLRYPVGVNLFNAVLLAAGVPVLLSLVWVGLAGSALTAFMLLRWGGAFALAAILFNGGIATGIAALVSDNPGEILHGVEWKNLFLTVFVTQRGFLWALPAGLLLFYVWRERLDGNRRCLPGWVEIVLYASMPLFHLHTFLFLSALLAISWLCAPGRAQKKAFLITGLAALVPASLLVWLTTGGFSTSGTVAFAPGWMQADEGLAFWWQNFGVSLLLLGVLGWEVAREGKRSERVFVGVGIAIFIACGLFRFAPWAWDNIKLMLWSWLACAPFLWQRILQPLHIAPRIGLILLLFYSGAFALLDGLSMQHRYALISRAELAHARAMVKKVPADARFAVAPDFAHPVILSGGSVAMGFAGHLWSHGYDYGQVESALRQLFTNPSDTTAGGLMAPVTHVFVGPRERTVFSNEIWLQAPAGWSVLESRGGATLFQRDPETD